MTSNIFSHFRWELKYFCKQQQKPKMLRASWIYPISQERAFSFCRPVSIAVAAASLPRLQSSFMVVNRHIYCFQPPAWSVGFSFTAIVYCFYICARRKCCVTTVEDQVGQMTKPNRFKTKIWLHNISKAIYVLV